MKRKELIELWNGLKEYREEFKKLVDIYELLTGIRNVRHYEQTEEVDRRDNFSTSQKWSNFVELTDQILAIESEEEFIKRAMDPSLDFIPIFRMMVHMHDKGGFDERLKDAIDYLQTQNFGEINAMFEPIQNYISIDSDAVDFNCRVRSGQMFMNVAYDNNPECSFVTIRAILAKIGEVLINSIFYNKETNLQTTDAINLEYAHSSKVFRIDELLADNGRGVFNIWIAAINKGIAYRDQYLWMVEN